MSRAGHIQTTQPSYEGGACITDYLQEAAYRYLTRDKGFEIYSNVDDGEYADYWEIYIDSAEHIREIINDLREDKNVLDKYITSCPELIGQGCGEELADLLETGLEVAEKKGYHTINIDWF